VSLTREDLLRSLARQRERLADSIVLTPVDSLPFLLADREHTGFLHGVYLTDKVRDRDAKKDAPIQFPGRDDAARDLAAIHRLLAEAFGGTTASLRILAGLHAHASTFMSIASPGDCVLLLSEEAGGHFNTHSILERLGLRLIDLPIDYDHLCIDRAATLELVERTRPDFVFVDRSEGLRYEDFAFLGALDGPVKIFDASQYVTPIVTGRYTTPLAWGFDLVLFSLHKSFPGPQKAGIVGREDGDLWRRLLQGLSTLVSSSHAENSYLLGLSLLRERWLEDYAQRMFAVAGHLEEELAARNVPVVARHLQGRPEWPATHHLWIRAPDRDAAFALYERLEAINIHTNYRKLPYRLGHGLRLGTTFCSVAGLDPDDTPELAEILVATTTGEASPDVLRKRVRALAHEARGRAILPPAYWT
jgi:glycine hydroxymethyltransferase